LRCLVGDETQLVVVAGGSWSAEAHVIFDSEQLASTETTASGHRCYLLNLRLFALAGCDGSTLLVSHLNVALFLRA